MIIPNEFNDNQLIVYKEDKSLHGFVRSPYFHVSDDALFLPSVTALSLSVDVVLNLFMLN